ncbi:hypothetical protein MKX01_031074 [Papaver californicum]|nr:hypothetical protein MKX01_031074 [Papaver californicum]
MASFCCSSLIQFLLFCFFFSSCNYAHASSSSSSARPRSLVFPVQRDPSTLQHIIKLSQGTPSATRNLVLALGGELPYVRCDQSQYTSSTFRSIDCKSLQCSLASKYVGCAMCNKNKCSIYTSNPITHSPLNKIDLISDVVTAQSRYVQDPKSHEWFPGPNVTAPLISFGCGTTTGDVFDGLAQGADGFAGLGRSQFSLVSQLSATFHFPSKFALYLSQLAGFMFFGNRPYTVFREGDLAKGISYTPLLINPKHSDEYFIDVKSISIDGERIPINKTLLSISKNNGVGGTRVSTIVPSTTMETSIYKAFVSAYVKKAEAMNISRVVSVVPYDACFNASTFVVTRQGLLLPTVSLGLPNNVEWRILDQRNILRNVDPNMLCLAFADGGLKPRTSIVIGQDQILLTLLEFDMKKSRLGFRPYDV